MVIVELLAHNFKPYRPVVDDHGVDLMLSDGIRIQVKTANLSHCWGGKRRRTEKSYATDKMMYQFSLQRTVFGTKEKLQSVGITYEYRDISKEADFLILVGLDERRFWIVPTGVIAECTHVAIAQGVSRAKNGPRSRFWKSVRDGENRWDMLSHRVTNESRDEVAVNLPDIYDRDPNFVATFAGLTPVEETLQ